MALCTAAVACGLACLLDARVRFFVLRTLCVAVYFLTLVSAENILFQNLFLNVANSFVVRSLCVAVFSPLFSDSGVCEKRYRFKMCFSRFRAPLPQRNKVEKMLVDWSLAWGGTFFRSASRRSNFTANFDSLGGGGAAFKNMFSFRYLFSQTPVPHLGVEN